MPTLTITFTITLVLIKEMTLEDESNTHLALGRGGAGGGGVHWRSWRSGQGSIQSRSMSCGMEVGNGQAWKGEVGCVFAAGWEGAAADAI